MTDQLLRTPLHSRHLSRGAKMGDFGGWDMPIEFSGTIAEHTAVRSTVGFFDVSHMGKIRVSGTDAVAFLNAHLTNDLERIRDGHAQYSMLCNESGGVIDDLIVYRWSLEHVFIIPNASNAHRVVAALSTHRPEGIQIEDLHNELGIIAVQGPLSGQILADMGLPTDLDYMAMVDARYRGHDIVVCRTGYTGEKGFEIVAPHAILPEIWDELCDRSAAVSGMPAGLGARDTLRTEMGYPLHGQDISADITPGEAGLSWAVGWNKPDFAGKAALVEQREQGIDRRLVALLAHERGIPRPHLAVLDAEGNQPLGEVTSGTFSPTLKQGIALALVDSRVVEGQEVLVDIRGRSSKFKVVALPFVASSAR